MSAALTPNPPSGRLGRLLRAQQQQRKARNLVAACSRLAKGTGRNLGSGNEQFYKGDQLVDSSKNRTLTDEEVEQCKRTLLLPPDERTPQQIGIAVLSWIMNLPIFKKLQANSIKERELLQALVLTEYEAREVVFREEDEAEDFHIIITGEVDVQVLDRNDRSVHHSVAALKAGETFGELGLLGSLGSNRRSATILCKVPSMLLSLPKQYFQNVVREGHEKQVRHKVNFLLHVDAFRNCDPQKLRRLAYFLKECVFEHGEVLVNAGEKVDTLFFLRSGECRMIAPSPGAWQRLCLLLPQPATAVMTADALAAGKVPVAPGKSYSSKSGSRTPRSRIQPGLLARHSQRTAAPAHIASVCGGGIVGDSAVLMPTNNGAAPFTVVCSSMVTAYRIKRLDFFKRVDNEALTALKTMARVKETWYNDRLLATKHLSSDADSAVPSPRPRKGTCHEQAAMRLISTGSSPRLKERRMENAGALDRVAASTRTLLHHSPRVKLPMIHASSARERPRPAMPPVRSLRRLKSLTGRGYEGSNPICVKSG